MPSDPNNHLTIGLVGFHRLVCLTNLLSFTSRTKAARLGSSLHIGAVALRQERESVTIDGPAAVADLCVEMRFFDREVLRVVLLNAKQKLIDAR